jgi:hypothetical protein
MYTRKLIAIFLTLTSFSVYAKEAYDCNGFGFTIDGNKAAYGPDELTLCSTKGNWIEFAQSGECKKMDRWSLTFDRITYLLMVDNPDNSSNTRFSNTKCKKIK